MSTENALRAALLLVERGYAVFPCNEKKAPACPGGFKSAARDPDAVRALWQSYPGELVGVPTGAVNGIAVLDFDFAKHPEAAQWSAEHGPALPQTFVLETRSGGQHWYFRHRAGLRCSTSRIAPGVDVRGDGGYAVSWSAAGYPILSDAPLAPWPSFLDEMLDAKSDAKATMTPPPPDSLKAKDAAALAAIVRQLPNGPEFKDRNEWLKLAHALAAAFADDPGLAADLFIEHAAKCEQTPGEPERLWATLQGPHRVGADWIIAKARRCGIDVQPYACALAQAAFAAAGPIPADPDIAAPPASNHAVVVARLAELDPVAYDLCRHDEAKKLGIRISALDGAVKAARSASGNGDGRHGGALGLAAPEPFPDPVDGCELLSALAAFFAHHLFLPAGAADALAVWTVHTYCFDAARHTPRLAITSPEKQCGKTTVLDLLEMVVSKPLPTANVSAAAVFRTVEACAPTLLVDEADTFLGDSEGLRGVLNAGHKRGGQVIRCVGDSANIEPRTFACFAPAAIAAIGALPGTIMDRSIALRMRRASRGERPQPIRSSTERAGGVLARKAARWAADHAAELIDIEPPLPEGMANRTADNWRCLFAIAEAAGGDWPVRLERASNALGDGDDGRESLGTALLHDVRQVFRDAFTGKDNETGTGIYDPVVHHLATAEIVRRLNEMDDRPWPEVSHGRPLTAARFTRMVKRFDIVRRQRRVAKNNDLRIWGYYAADFADAFDRYLPPWSPPNPENTGGMVTTKESPGEPGRP